MRVFKNDCKNGPAKILPVGPVAMATNWAPVVIRATKGFCWNVSKLFFFKLKLVTDIILK